MTKPIDWKDISRKLHKMERAQEEIISTMRKNHHVSLARYYARASIVKGLERQYDVSFTGSENDAR